MNHTTANQQLALARRDGLVISELPDEVLVYDLNQNKAHCLNQTAAQVWNLCDGQTTVTEIARMLAQEANKPVDEEVVWLALKQLGKANLLQERMSMPGAGVNFSRRLAMRRLGLAAAIVLPLVTSIVAPMAVSAASCPAQCRDSSSLFGSAANCGGCSGVTGRKWSGNGCSGTATAGTCDTCVSPACKSWSNP